MPLTALELERYSWREVTVFSPIHGVMRGKIEPPEPGLDLMYFHEHLSTSYVRRLMSHSAIEAVWDNDPTWNDCPACEVEAGSKCVSRVERDREVNVHHMERFAHSQVDNFKKVRDAAIVERNRLASARRSTDINAHTGGLMGLPAIAGGAPPEGAPF